MSVRVGPVAHSDQSIGRNVRILRNARGMTGEEMAARCGIGYQRHMKLEAGGIPFDIDLLVRVAGVLDTTPGRLLDGRVSGRMLDLNGLDDDVASALEIMHETLLRAKSKD